MKHYVIRLKELVNIMGPFSTLISKGTDSKKPCLILSIPFLDQYSVNDLYDELTAKADEIDD